MTATEKRKMVMQDSMPDMHLFDSETNPKTPRRDFGASADDSTSLFGDISFHPGHSSLLQSPMSPGGLKLPVKK